MLALLLAVSSRPMRLVRTPRAYSHIEAPVRTGIAGSAGVAPAEGFSLQGSGSRMGRAFCPAIGSAPTDGVRQPAHCYQSSQMVRTADPTRLHGQLNYLE